MTGILDYFLGERIVASLADFLITIERDDPALEAAALAIAATAEADQRTLEGWFGIRLSDLPYGIWVSVRADAGVPHAYNDWHGDSSSPQIAIFNATVANAANSPYRRDELARMLFVAELAEVCMQISPNGWDPSNSAGEALSRVAAAELHPDGYYRPIGTPNNGPYAGQWLALVNRSDTAQLAGAGGARYDFISVSEGTDANRLSFGCGTLFLYYLHSQLNFSWSAIASSWGQHLGETYAQLTGRPKEDAFGAFSGCLGHHFPPGSSQLPSSENVFPLSADPHIVLVPSVTSKGHVGRLPHFATMKPGPLCPPGQYTYYVSDVTSTLTVNAYAPGSFAPGFIWTVAGHKLDTGTDVIITLSVNVVDVLPNRKLPAGPPTPMQFSYTISQTAKGGRLALKNLEFPGNIAPLEISVVMQEANDTRLPGLYKASTLEGMLIRGYLFDEDWYDAVARCTPKTVNRTLNAYASVLQHLKDLGHLPDPPPERLAPLIAAAVRYAESLSTFEKETGLRSKLATDVLSRSRIPRVEMPALVVGDRRFLAAARAAVPREAPRVETPQSPEAQISAKASSDGEISAKV